jgi:hypothetical protein
LQVEVQASLDIDRQTFSARLLSAARRAAPDLFVMTQANIESLVRAAGKTLEQCEGQCAVDTGKMIGADLVISGRIARVGHTYAITMQLYDTASGELLAGEDPTAKTEDDLLEVSASAAERLTKALVAGQAPPLRRATFSEGHIGESGVALESAGPEEVLRCRSRRRATKTALNACRPRRGSSCSTRSRASPPRSRRVGPGRPPGDRRWLALAGR